MGEVNQDGMVLDVSDELIGHADLGKGTLKDKSGSHFATVQRDGTVLDKNELQRGSLKNFTYHKMKLFASYVFFFDGRLIEDRLSTKLTAEDSEGGVDSTSIQNFSTHEDGEAMSKEEARLMRHVKHGAAAAPRAAAPKAAAPAAAKSAISPRGAATTSSPRAAEPASPRAPAQTSAAPAQSTTPASNEQSDKAVEVRANSAASLDPNSMVDERGLVQDADEKARREAERMNRMMGGITVAPAASSKPKVSQHDLVSAKYPIPARPEVKSQYETELWTEINRARTSPNALVSALESMKANFEGKNYNYPGTHTTRPTQEGASAVEAAIAFLKSQKAVEPLQLADGLSLSCRDLVKLAAERKDFGSLETEEQGSARLTRYGRWSGKLLQNLAVGNLSPQEIVLTWIIDDGNASREHRASVFSSDVHFVGIASGPHIELARTTVACFTSKFEDAAPQGSAPSGPTGPVYTAPASDGGAPEVSAETEYKVGPLSDGGDKYFLDISNLGCPAAGLEVKLLESGKSLSVRRSVRVNGQLKEAVHKLKLPFQLVPHQVQPVFNATTGILTLNLSKPNASGSTQAMKIGEFTVPGWPSSAIDKVSVQANSGSDAYVFVCEPSKYATKVAVSIGADKKLTFDMQYTFDTVVEGQPATKTVKLSSEFGLPFDVSPEQISVAPNGDKGSQVKILKSKPSPDAISIADTVIPIQ